MVKIKALCILCGLSFSYKKNLKRHFKIKHVTKEYKCDMCKYEATFEKELKEHIKIVHNRRVFNCDIAHFKLKQKFP